MQVSFDPLLPAVSINPGHSSYGMLKEGRAFSINVLKKSQLDLAGYYGGPASADKKLTLTEWTTDHSGLPLLREALAWFECQALPRRRPPAGLGK
jgi:flavin reductase (DIM6/NTAB) family NADH-FMN oxidoreductase RutF